MKLNSTWLNWCREYKKYPYTQIIELTHKLFLENLGNKDLVKKIAKKREVNEETIERQLIILIVKGIIDVKDIVLEEKIKEVEKILNNEMLVKLGEIKEKVDEKISWFEIKSVIASKGVEA